MYENVGIPRSDVPHPLITPSGTEPYYIMSVWMWKNSGIHRSDVYPPLVDPSVTEPYYTMSIWHVEQCRHTQIRYTTESTLVVQSPTTPCQFDMWKHEDIPKSHVSPCQLHLILQSPTTPCQLDMWKTVGIPRSHVHPLLIEPSATEPYYTMSVWYVEKCRCTQVRCNPTPTTPAKWT